MKQTELFSETKTEDAIAPERIVLYAFGEFQARGKALAERELPLDRLRGALRRAAETFGVAELSDETAVATIQRLGASVRRVPPYVAKHPFRVIVPPHMAEQSRRFYQDTQADATPATARDPGSP